MPAINLASVVDAGGPGAARRPPILVLRVASAALAATALVSALLFGLYILAFYAGALTTGQMAEWNRVLPRLYEPETPAATTGIGLHFAAGGIILVLGGIQLVAPLRRRCPAVHRWLGRVYVTASLLAAVGGLAFIVLKGTIGGPVMNTGFGLYGILMGLAAVQTARHARARRLEPHRAWALRLFALAIGSWLYRMDYGFWIMLTGGAGHRDDFRGPFDIVMAFFFYLPNLVMAELFIRSRQAVPSRAVQATAAAVFTAATVFLLIGTFYFTKFYWGPAIVRRLGGDAT